MTYPPGSTVTAAVLLARTSGFAGEPGIFRGRSRGASRETVTDRSASCTARQSTQLRLSRCRLRAF